uniref:Uncharacterized protein n=1 Tax=Arundo donax TaxID=35708 RepID=A0A0A9H6N8_ARUDO
MLDLQFPSIHVVALLTVLKSIKKSEILSKDKIDKQEIDICFNLFHLPKTMSATRLESD